MRKIWLQLMALLAAAASTVACGGGGLTPPAQSLIQTASPTANVVPAAPTPSASPAPTSTAAPAPAPAPAQTAPTAPTGSATVTLDQLPGWESCDTCAGAGGKGPKAAHGLNQGVTSPSMDGASAHFWLGGNTPYSDVLWHKNVLNEGQVQANRAAHHFIYDLYFYADNAAAAQSIEWDVNQFVDGRSYIFGSQCSYLEKDTWDVWDNVKSSWVSTGISCGALQSNTWNHVILEFERTTDNQLHYISFTLNGSKHYLNWYYPSTATSWSGVTVNYQMDGDSRQTNYSTWVDKMNLNYW